MKVLISDKIDETSFSLLKDKSIVFDYQPEIDSASLLRLIPDYVALIVRSRTKVTKRLIEKGVNLKVIGRIGTGVDNINVDTCKERKIIIVNAPDANSQSAAEHTIGLIFSLLRNYKKAFSSMKEGLWLKRELTGSELNGKTVGILGYGHVGKRVEKLVSAFGAKTLVHCRSYMMCSLREIFEKGDIVTLHLSLNDKTRGCVTKDLLRLMKRSAFFINTSRGEIVDQKALYEVLEDNKIKGAALDVFWQEPLSANSPWRKLDNVVLTPHIAASTKEALEKASKVVIKDVVRILKGAEVRNLLSF